MNLYRGEQTTKPWQRYSQISLSQLTQV